MTLIGPREATGFEFVLGITELTGIKVQAFPLHDLGAVIVARDDEWILSVPDDCSLEHLRWTTTVAVACRFEWEMFAEPMVALEQAKAVTRDVLMDSTTMTDPTCGCVHELAKRACVPIHLAMDKLISTGLLDLDGVLCTCAYARGTSVADLTEPMITLIMDDEPAKSQTAA